MNRPLTVSLTALPLGWLLLALMGSAASMTAQVTATLEVDKSRLLPRETFNVSLKIVNFSGQTLVFGEDNDWLQLEIETETGEVLTPIAEPPKVEGRFTVESSIRATKRIDLESGIVGEDVIRERLAKRLVLQPSGDFARLLRGVRGEAIAVFNDWRGIRKSGQR